MSFTEIGLLDRPQAHFSAVLALRTLLPPLCRYYTAYNAGDIDTLAALMAPDVVYHDMIYEEPFRGREEVVSYLKKVSAAVG